MAQPRIRHIAINVEDREASASYYESIFGMEIKLRGENDTIYLSDGHVGLALISFGESTTSGSTSTASTTSRRRLKRRGAARSAALWRRAGFLTLRVTGWTLRRSAGLFSR